MPEDYNKLPLRERLTIAEHLTRELSEHIEQGFLPKIEELRKITRHKGSVSTEVTDKTVRDTGAKVCASEEYTAELFAKLQSCLKSIAAEVQTLVHGD